MQSEQSAPEHYKKRPAARRTHTRPDRTCEKFLRIWAPEDPATNRAPSKGSTVISQRSDGDIFIKSI